MTARRPKYSKEEFARRVDAIYDRDITPHATADQIGQFVAIDSESGAFENADEHTAAHRLEERFPMRRLGCKEWGFGLPIGLVSNLRWYESGAWDGLELTWIAVS